MGLAVYSIAMRRHLPEPGRMALDGVTTIREADEACRRTRLHGNAKIPGEQPARNLFQKVSLAQAGKTKVKSGKTLLKIRTRV